MRRGGVTNVSYSIFVLNTRSLGNSQKDFFFFLGFDRCQNKSDGFSSTAARSPLITSLIHRVVTRPSADLEAPTKKR